MPKLLHCNMRYRLLFVWLTLGCYCWCCSFYFNRYWEISSCGYCSLAAFTSVLITGLLQLFFNLKFLGCEIGSILFLGIPTRMPTPFPDLKLITLSCSLPSVLGSSVWLGNSPEVCYLMLWQAIQFDFLNFSRTQLDFGQLLYFS